MDRQFIDACEFGDFDEAKRLYKLGVNIHALDDVAFLWTCYRGDSKMTKWLVSLGDVDIYIKQNYALRISYNINNLEVAKWLYSKYDKSKNYDFEEYHKIKQLIEEEKDNYNGIMNNSMFEMNLFTMELSNYLFY